MKILVGIDGGAQQDAALTLGVELAHGGELVVATVYPAGRSTARLGAAYATTVEQDARALLETATERLDPGTFSLHAVGELSAPRALHRLAVDEQVDAIVIGSSSRGRVARALLGGTGERVVHGAPVPVAAAPRDYAGGPDRLQRIGVAYDGGAESEAALGWAVRLAQDAGASLEVLSVAEFLPVAMYPGVAAYPTDDLVRELHEEAERAVQEAVERVSSTVAAGGRALDGTVVRSLVDATAALDLMVVGSRGYGPLGSLLLGSVSSAVMHEAECPVVVVPRSAAE